MKEQKLLNIAVALITAMALLCGMVLCDSVKETTITASVSPYISITPPEMSSTWSIDPINVNTITKNLIVDANTDWEVGVKAPNGAYMKAVGPTGANYTLSNYIQISTTDVRPFKPSATTNNYFLKNTTRGANQKFPITFQQQGSLDDVVEENGTSLAYSIVVTFTGKLQ